MQTQTNLDNDMHVKFFCVKSNAFIESCTLAIIEIHCNINLQTNLATKFEVQLRRIKTATFY